MGAPAPLPMRRVALLVAAVLVASMLGAAAGALTALVRGAPSLDELRFDPRQTTYIYDRKGNVITYLAYEHRVPLTIDEIPKVMQQAVIAVEDDEFLRHHGIDFKAILRALWVDLRSGRIVQGGGTITMQLARTAFLSQERTFTRKIKEAIWAIQIERRYTKEEILAAYLNQFYLGKGAYGVEAAAQTYFGKSVREVTLAEAALLAGLARSPESLYDPYRHPDQALARRNFVLDRMVEVGFISPRAAEEAKRQPLGVTQRSSGRKTGQYFIDHVIQEILNDPERYSFSEQNVKEEVWGGGLRIYTTLDLGLQAQAERLTQTIPIASKNKGGLSQPQYALVTVDPQTGDVLAMVGGRGEDQYNRALLATRQPGSAIKPFVWLAAIDKRIATPATVFDDRRLPAFVNPDGTEWSPRNYDDRYYGRVTLREALERSLNSVSVQLLQEVDPGVVMSYMKSMGITTLVPADRHLALALGGLTNGVTPLEMAAAYAVLASGGVYSKPRFILRIEDPRGFVLYEAPLEQKAVVSETSTYLVTDMMRGVIDASWGTGRSARLGRPQAGKTGTTQDNTNAWFVGFTPDLVTAVWIGNDAQSEPLSFGGATASAYWGQYMREAVKSFPMGDFARPDGLVTARIDTLTGLLAPADCGLPPEQVREEIFAPGTQPTEVSPNCQRPWLQVPDWLREPIEGLFGGGEGGDGTTP